ncbi:MAG TPA: dUTP diphosphatase [Polyangium sp.]|nr:dUTP diphosphatase [Polyangium sp.]
MTSRPAVRVPCKRVGSVEVPLPAYQSAGAAGLDLCAAIEDDVVIESLQRKLIPTGLSIAIPLGYEGQVRPRSGLALRHGITVLNSPGTIDADYRGEVKVLLVNLSDTPFRLSRGERIAQLVICPVELGELVLVDELDATERGAGGYGSTGR